MLVAIAAIGVAFAVVLALTGHIAMLKAILLLVGASFFFVAWCVSDYWPGPNFRLPRFIGLGPTYTSEINLQKKQAVSPNALELLLYACAIIFIALAIFI